MVGRVSRSGEGSNASGAETDELGLGGWIGRRKGHASGPRSEETGGRSNRCCPELSYATNDPEYEKDDGEYQKKVQHRADHPSRNARHHPEDHQNDGKDQKVVDVSHGSKQ
jgi:hypothetical protein